MELESIYLKKRAKLTRQQNWVKLGFVLCFMFLISGTVLLLWKQKQLKRQFQLQEAKEALLHLQMNPHFLFNALSSIQSLLFDQRDKIVALQYLSKFALLMRAVLANAQETKVAIANEIKLLEHYLAIQQLRFEHLFDFEIELAANVLTWKTFIPPFLLQPFIEMAIEQGQFDKMKNAWIKIDIKKEKALILLSITDNGQPRFSKMSEGKEVPAVEMTHKRLKIINKLWHKPIQFNIEESPQKSVKVIFLIPI